MSFRLYLIFTFILFARPQDFFAVLIPLRLAFVMTILMAVVTACTGKVNFVQGIFKFTQVKKYILIYIIMIVGIPFSMHRGQSFNFVFMQYSMKIIFFMLSLLYLDSIKKLEKFLFVICFSCFFYACFSLINSGSLSGRFAYGTMYDPNDLAAFLIALFPINFYFLTTGRFFARKLFAVTSIGISVAVILMTGSRGGLLGLVVVLLLLFVTRLGQLKRSTKIVLFATLVAVLAVNYDKINIERYQTIFNIEDDYNVSGEEGRLSIWGKGLELSVRHPLTGVGADCFAMALGYYREKLGEKPIWQTAHNSYILFLAEIGVAGFFLYMSLVFSSLKIFLRYSREYTLPDKFLPLSNMSKSFVLSFAGYLICAFFLSHAYSGIFTLFFALSVVLQNLYSFPEKDLT